MYLLAMGITNNSESKNFIQDPIEEAKLKYSELQKLVVDWKKSKNPSVLDQQDIDTKMSEINRLVLSVKSDDVDTFKLIDQKIVDVETKIDMKLIIPNLKTLLPSAQSILLKIENGNAKLGEISELRQKISSMLKSLRNKADASAGLGYLSTLKSILDEIDLTLHYSEEALKHRDKVNNRDGQGRGDKRHERKGDKFDDKAEESAKSSREKLEKLMTSIVATQPVEAENKIAVVAPQESASTYTVDAQGNLKEEINAFPALVKIFKNTKSDPNKPGEGDELITRYKNKNITGILVEYFKLPQNDHVVSYFFDKVSIYQEDKKTTMPGLSFDEVAYYRAFVTTLADHFGVDENQIRSQLAKIADTKKIASTISSDLAVDQVLKQGGWDGFKKHGAYAGLVNLADTKTAADRKNASVAMRNMSILGGLFLLKSLWNKYSLIEIIGGAFVADAAARLAFNKGLGDTLKAVRDGGFGGTIFDSKNPEAAKVLENLTGDQLSGVAFLSTIVTMADGHEKDYITYTNGAWSFDGVKFFDDMTNNKLKQPTSPEQIKVLGHLQNLVKANDYTTINTMIGGGMTGLKITGDQYNDAAFAGVKSVVENYQYNSSIAQDVITTYAGAEWVQNHDMQARRDEMCRTGTLSGTINGSQTTINLVDVKTEADKKKLLEVLKKEGLVSLKSSLNGGVSEVLPGYNIEGELAKIQLSNVDDADKTREYIKSGFSSYLTTLSSEHRKYVQLIVTPDGELAIQVMKSSGKIGVLTKIKIEGQKQIHIQGLGDFGVNEEFHVESTQQGWKDIIELAGNDVMRTQTFAGASSNLTANDTYRSVGGGNELLFNNNSMKSSLTGLLSGMWNAPYLSDDTKIPKLLQGNIKKLQAYVGYLNGQEVEQGISVWTVSKPPKGRESVESSYQLVNGASINASSATTEMITQLSTVDPTKATDIKNRILAGKLSLSINGDIITLTEKEKNKTISIKKSTGSSNRWALYDESSTRKQFPGNQAYDGIGSLGQVLGTATYILDLKVKNSLLGHSEFANPFFVNTRDVHTLFGASIGKSDGDMSIYFMSQNDGLGGEYGTDGSSVTRALKSAKKEKVLDYSMLKRLCPDAANNITYLTGWINDIPTWHINRPPTDAQIAYDTFGKKMYKSLDEFVRATGKLGWGWMKDGTSTMYQEGVKPAIETGYEDLTKGMKRLVIDAKDGYKFIESGGQPDNFKEYILQEIQANENYESLQPKAKRDFVCEKVLKFHKYAPGFSLVSFFHGRELVNNTESVTSGTGATTHNKYILDFKDAWWLVTGQPDSYSAIGDKGLFLKNIYSMSQKYPYVHELLVPPTGGSSQIHTLLDEAGLIGDLGLRGGSDFGSDIRSYLEKNGTTMSRPFSFQKLMAQASDTMGGLFTGISDFTDNRLIPTAGKLTEKIVGQLKDVSGEIPWYGWLAVAFALK